jgi:hypothetical protein
MNPRPMRVIAKDNFLIQITFENGEVRLFDMKPFLNFGVFKELNEIPYFKKVMIQNKSVCWPNEQDVCPDTLYLDSVPLGGAVA